MGTISDRLDGRLAAFVNRNGVRPDDLPVTLDEWVQYAEFIWGPYDIRVVPMRYDGIPFRLVQQVIDNGISIVVRP